MTKPIVVLAVARRGSATVSPVDGSRAAESAARPWAHPGARPRLEEIYREHGAAVAKWVGWLVGREVEIEDIVHEVFLVVHKRLHTFRGDASVTTWLYGITIRVVSDRRRARRWRRWFGLRGGRDAPAGDVMENLQATDRSPLELLEQEEARRLTYRILDDLSEAHRAVLILFELQGLTGQEIAEVTGTSVANVWLRLHRARKQFSRRFLALEAKNEGGREHE